MHKTLLFIFAMLFAAGLNGQDKNLQKKIEQRVRLEIEGKTISIAKQAFDQIINEIKSGEITLDGETCRLNEADAEAGRKEAFRAYVDIFLKYSYDALNQGKDIQFIKDEAKRLLDMEIGPKTGQWHTNLTRTFNRASGLLDNQGNEGLTQLRQRINQMRRDSMLIANDNAKLQAIVDSLTEETSGDNPPVRISANKDAKKWQNNYNRIIRFFSAKDSILYKECLRFPLQHRCDPKRVNEALTVIASYSELDIASSTFKELQDTYEPLLRHYSQYNNDLIEHIQERINFINNKQQVTGKTTFTINYDDWKAKLSTLSYYSLYEKRTFKPWKSIDYLDERIKEYEDLLARKPKDTEALKQALQAIINKLRPKQ